MDYLMEQVTQATELGEALGRFIFGLGFLLFSLYEFAVFFRFLVRRWRDDGS